MSSLLARLRFPLDHRWAPDRMSDYLDGELAPRGRARIERHVLECAECRRLMAGLKLVVEGLHRLPAPEQSRDPVAIAGAVRQRLGEPPTS